MSDRDCTHEDFNAHVEVNRITQVEGGPPVVYTAEIKVECRKCGQEMEFVGLPHGMSFYRPTMSMNCDKVCLPMVIPGEEVPAGLAGFSVTQTVFKEQDEVVQ